MTKVQLFGFLVLVVIFDVQARHLQTDTDVNPMNTSQTEDTESGSTSLPFTTDSAAEIITELPEVAPYSPSGQKPSTPFKLPADKKSEKLETDLPATTQPSMEDLPLENPSTSENQQSRAVNADSEVFDLIGSKESETGTEQGQQVGVYYVQVPNPFVQRFPYIASVPSSGFIQSAPIVGTQPILAANLVPEVFTYGS